MEAQMAVIGMSNTLMLKTLKSILESDGGTIALVNNKLEEDELKS